jgi:carbon-monoxide dehydrogenase medium subunit
MIPASFDYVRATSLAQAIGLLQKDSDGTRLVAGGHTLIPTLKLRLASPALLVDIGGITELKGIEVGDRIRIGALTTHAELLASEPLRKVLPIFHQTADLIADPQVRQCGPCGGLAGGRRRAEGGAGAGGPDRPPARRCKRLLR